MWVHERPPKLSNPVLIEEFTGEASLSKYDRLAERLSGDPLLITTLDDIAWLLNCRGSDLKYSFAFYSYATFFPKTKTVRLYINPVQVMQAISYLASINVTVVPIGEIDSDLAAMAEAGEEKLNILADTCNAHLAGIIENIRVDLLDNPFATLKTNKNAAEQ